MRLESKRNELEQRLLYRLELVPRVIEQTRQRVLPGRELPAKEKIVGVFETHPDILAKQRRDTVFVHKICLAGGVSCLITVRTIAHGNPTDALLAPK